MYKVNNQDKSNTQPALLLQHGERVPYEQNSSG